MNLKKTFFVTLFFLIIVPLSVFGQSVKITSKKVTYTRPNPTSDFKKTFTVTYPKVNSSHSKLAQKIEDAISFQKVLNFHLSDELGEYQWLEEASFDVAYNQKGILNIYLSMSGIGAHETFFGKYATVDLKNGNRVMAKDLFINLNGLVTKIRKLQKDEIAYSVEDIKKQTDFGDVDTTELFKYAKFQKIHLEEFSIATEGVTFHYSYSFPYIYRTIEPTGSFFLDWKSLKPFIRRKGLLGKFIH